ncbi:hypothetical protein [Verrucosispora sp. TAA-831]|uniref:hypothetical protein n=1 Tax=Verrucosispora sp. TAA-831 TaxID=3422227 RepID=UPI003D6F6B9C
MSATPAGVVVSIVERRAPAPPTGDKAEAVDKLTGLGFIDGPPTFGEVVGYDVVVAGSPVAVPCMHYEVTPAETGGQLVTITLPADSVAVSVDQPSPTGAKLATVPAVGRRTPWEPSRVDPRAAIPGWEPEEVPDRG